MSQDETIRRGLLAHRRKQQRLTDREDRAALHALILDAGPDGLVLDARYGIKLTYREGPDQSWEKYGT